MKTYEQAIESLGDDAFHIRMKEGNPLIELQHQMSMTAFIYELDGGTVTDDVIHQEIKARNAWFTKYER